MTALPAGRMHADELATDASLVRRLLQSQLPQWASLSIEPVASAGTENAIFRLGDDMAVRLPRRPGGAEQSEKLHRWLPALGPSLPLAVPVPLARGTPTAEYPAHWSVCAWLEGTPASSAPLADPVQAALALAGFVSALQRIDASGGPVPGHHCFFRGVPLAARDAQVRSALESLRGVIDTQAVASAWSAALAAPPWPRPPVWIHGDLRSDNLLVVQGELRAVIDFGGLCVGDPACDLILAWDLFTAGSRAAFRSASAVDEASWARGRGWALSVAVLALPYYLESNPDMVRYAHTLLDQVLA
jgi:aminoglycoside phosphotransferase (APT) family kinase protein